jgi:poly-gamma-glutamate synthesis protein (capsule biosynthesis protein)
VYSLGTIGNQLPNLRTVRILFLITLFLAACHPLKEVPSATPIPTSTATPVEILAMQPTVTSTNIAAPTLTPDPTPTVQPTQTPLPIVRLAVPPRWQARAAAALDQYAQKSATRILQIAPDDKAEIRLINEESELAIMKEPLVLTVPFTSEWQNISLEEALEVITAGHNQINVMPWSEMPLGMKAIRVDGRFPAEPDYPLQDAWSLQVAPGYEDAAKELLPFLQTVSVDPLVHIVAVGDIMLDRSLGAAIQNGYLDYPFSAVSEHLRAADITIGNVESALGDTGEPVSKRYPFRAPPEAAESLALAGFDIVSLANNHAGDYGSEALLQAISLLIEQGVSPIGVGANAQEAHAPNLSEVNGLKLAFFSYVNVPIEASTGFDTASWEAGGDTPGIAWADPEQITADVVAIHDQVDLVVVALHSGFEYLAAPSEPQMAAARAAIDAGADLVIGHHAHILQGIEFYGDGVILYGTGNFAFEIDGPPETALFDIWLDGKGVRQIEVNPAIIQFGGQPRLAESWEDPAILSQLYYLTNILNAN